MNLQAINSVNQASDSKQLHPEEKRTGESKSLQQILQDEFKEEVKPGAASVREVTSRIVAEVKRVCSKSKRIQKSGEVRRWQISLGRHRLNKCLSYYRLGSEKGRVELHSNLSVMIYRHIAPTKAQLGFAGRYNLIEDFLQDFYAESLKAFRRENEVEPDYQPRTKLQLAEYMSFTEQYAKRRITLPNGYSQQLIILRAQSFARRQPQETSVDIEQAMEFPKGEDSQSLQSSPVMYEVRSKMVSENPDPWKTAVRDRLVHALFEYLEANGHSDCADYLTLKLQDLPASEIDEILGLSPRERDYLQQRFKYHVEKFSRSSHWELVHQWLEADLEQKLGLTSKQWNLFVQKLSGEQRQLLQLKELKKDDEEIAEALGCTPKKVQKRWTKLLELAWKMRNDGSLD